MVDPIRELPHSPNSVRTPCPCGHAHADHTPAKTDTGWSLTCNLCDGPCWVLDKQGADPVAEAEQFLRRASAPLHRTIPSGLASKLDDEVYQTEREWRYGAPKRRLRTWWARAVRRRLAARREHFSRAGLLWFAEQSYASNPRWSRIPALPKVWIQPMGNVGVVQSLDNITTSD